MRHSKRTFVGLVIAVTAALTVLSVSPVQAAPDKDKEPVTTAVPKDSSLAPDGPVEPPR